MGTAPHTDITADEMMESLTGFDEIFIRKHFERPIDVLGGADRLQFLRALIFTHYRREGEKEVSAYKAAQGLTLVEIKGYFAEDDELVPDDPVTDAGKDDETPESPPASSPSGVSSPTSPPPSSTP